jgi:hypothetical protein
LPARPVGTDDDLPAVDGHRVIGDIGNRLGAAAEALVGQVAQVTDALPLFLDRQGIQGGAVWRAVVRDPARARRI